MSLNFQMTKAVDQFPGRLEGIENKVNQIEVDLSEIKKLLKGGEFLYIMSLDLKIIQLDSPIFMLDP